MEVSKKVFVCGPMFLKFRTHTARATVLVCVKFQADTWRNKKLFPALQFPAAQTAESTRRRQPQPSVYPESCGMPFLVHRWADSLDFFFQKTQLAQTQLSVAKLFKSRQPFVSYSHSRPSTTLKRPVPHMQDLYMRERLRSGSKFGFGRSCLPMAPPPRRSPPRVPA